MATIDDVKAAYLAVTRTTITDAAATVAAAQIDAKTTTLADFVSQTIASTPGRYTQADVATYAILTGNTPSEAQLTSLAAFTKAQTDSYAAKGYNVSLAPFETLGAALATDAGSKAAFNTKYGSLSVQDFITQIYQQANNVTPTFTGNPNGGETTNGDHFIAQLLSYTARNVANGIPAADAALQARGAIAGQIIAQAFIDPATSATATLDDATVNFLTAAANKTAVFGAPLSSTPGATPTVNFTLTQNIDAGAAFTTSAAGAVFNALPVTTPLGVVLDTLTVGDTLTDTNSKADGTLNVTTQAAGVVNGVTLSGISTANVTNLAAGGFSGTITGLTTVNSLAGSQGGLTLGAAGQGLNTALKTLSSASSQNITVNVAAAALAGTTDAVTVNLTGTHGNGAGSNVITFASDGAAGTAAAPNNAYETETITATGKSYVQLSSGAAGTGVLSTTSLVLSGAGQQLLSAGAAGEFSKLKTIDATGSTGGVTITGAARTDGVVGDTFTQGLLNGNTALTSFKGGTGADFVDISSHNTAALLAGFTAGNLDGGTGTARDTLVIAGAVANGQVSTATALTASNFEVLGVTGLGGGAGAIDFTKLGTGIDTVKLFSPTAGNVSLSNVASTFTYDSGSTNLAGAAVGLQGGNNLTVARPAGDTGTADVFNLLVEATGGNRNFGNIVSTGFETINNTLTGAAAETYGTVTATPTAGQSVTLNIVDNISLAGGTSLTMGATSVGSGKIAITGSAVSGVTFTGAVTAGALDASGLTGILSTVNGLTMQANSGSVISVLGTGGVDTIIGSGLGTDVLSAGAGNDRIENHLSVAAPSFTSGASIITGTGNDLVVLRGDIASGGTPAANYLVVPNVTDFTVGTGANTDKIALSSVNTDYSGALSNTGGDIAAGDIAVLQALSTGQSVAASAGANVFKIGTGVAAGATIQATFNAAIGAGQITGVQGASEYVVTIFDSTNNKLDILSVNSGGNTVIATGDAVHLIGTINMTAADYANFNAAHIGNFI